MLMTSWRGSRRRSGRSAKPAREPIGSRPRRTSPSTARWLSTESAASTKSGPKETRRTAISDNNRSGLPICFMGRVCQIYNRPTIIAAVEREHQVLASPGFCSMRKKAGANRPAVS